MILENIDSIAFLGGAAAFLTTTSFIPQLLKTWKTKSAKDVSIGMFTMFITGVCLWCIYGWKIHAVPVLIANILTFILATTILLMKIIFENYNTKNKAKEEI